MAGEYDASGTLQKRYVFAGGGDDPLVEYDRGTGGTYTRAWLLPDERGSIVSHSDDSGTSTGVNSYDEHGVPASGNTGRFGYTGQAWLPELGLWYYKARMYAPSLGRFLQTDPIGYGDGMNWYDYAKSDPINGSDPGGLASTIGGCTGSIACTGTFSPGSIGIGTTGASGARADAMNYLEQAGFSGDTAEAAVNLATAYGSAAAALRVVQQEGDDQSGDVIVTGRRIAQVEPLIEPLLPDTIPHLLGIPGQTPCACFEAGTLVATPTGFKAIEKIEVGDLVLSEDERNGTVAAKKVTALIRPAPKPVYELAVRDSAGKVEVFHATGDHRWKVDPQGWTATANLRVNEHTATGSKTDVTVISVSLTHIVEPTYNLEVADWHTFMVGKDHVVVHNGGPCDDIFIKSGHATKHNVKNPYVLSELRRRGGRDWYKVYQDGWKDGQKFSYHYFVDETGRKEFEKYVPGWSNSE